MTWIACAEKMPPDNRLVICYIPRDWQDGTPVTWTMKILSRSARDGGRWWGVEPYEFQPTHWMPLPEPPKAKP